MDQGPRSYWAEFIGTFALCFFGQGAIAVQQLINPGGFGSLLPIAVAHGLILAVMVTALVHASGAHFNPAVTLGFVVTGRQSLTSAITYWLSQLLGAVVASLLLRAILPPEVIQATNLGVPALAPEITVASGVLLEMVLTFFLVTAVWGTTVDERAPKVGGFAIGVTWLAGILVAGPLTGAAMNPARAFGAALASGTWTHQGVYWVGPLAGGALAALAYRGIVLGRR